MVKLPEPQRAKKTKILKSKKHKWKQKEGQYRKFDIALYIICSLLLPNFATRRSSRQNHYYFVFTVRKNCILWFAFPLPNKSIFCWDPICRASLRLGLKLPKNFFYPLFYLLFYGFKACIA